MKNKIILLLFVVGIAFTSCQEDDPIFKNGATISASVSAVTIFDAPATVNFTVSTTDVSQLHLTGEVVDETLTVADGSASYTMTQADFGTAWAIDESAGFNISAAFDGYDAVSSFSIDVVSALSGSAPGTIEAYNRMDTMYVAFGAATMGGTIDNAVVTSMLNDDAEVVEDDEAGSDLEFEYMIWGADYSIGDTIVYEITATTGSNSESMEVMTVVVDKSMGTFMDAMLKESADTVMLAKDVYMSFTTGTTIASDEAEFVKIADLSSIADPIEFTPFATHMDGETLASFVDVVIGDVVGYKFMVGTTTYYGYFEVTDVMSSTIGDMEDGVYFKYRQNMMEM